VCFLAVRAGDLEVTIVTKVPTKLSDIYIYISHLAVPPGAFYPYMAYMVQLTAASSSRLGLWSASDHTLLGMVYVQ
jgi:hypothetical protein